MSAARVEREPALFNSGMAEPNTEKDKERAARKDPPIERDERNRERVRERMEKEAEPGRRPPRDE